MAEAFFDSVFSIADWVELLRNADVVYLHGVRWFGGLTRVFAGFFAGNGVRRGGRGKKAHLRG